MPKSVTVISTTKKVVSLKGATGPAGQGVPTGGNPYEVLRKSTGTDYDTGWSRSLRGSREPGGTINVSAATTYTVDMSLTTVADTPYTKYYINMTASGGNIDFTNATEGDVLVLECTHAGGSARTLSVNSQALDLPGSAGDIDSVVLSYDGTNWVTTVGKSADYIIGGLP